MRRGFWGGISIQLPWHLQRTEQQKDTYKPFTPERVYIPMQQHIGTPCTPLVEPGMRVLAGQPIGQAGEGLGAPVHASISGTVKEVVSWPQISGKEATTVVIENDFAGRQVPGQAHEKWRQLPQEEIVSLLSESGIVGMGGAAFPTHVKLKVKKDMEYCIINGCECEPMMAGDDAWMQENAQSVISGCRIAMRAIGAKKALLASEDNKPKALKALETAAEPFPELQVKGLATRYPQGGEKQLIQALLGREVPEGGLPSDVGVVMINAATASAIAAFFQEGTPLTHRVASITGDVAQPGNLLFPVGTLAGDLIDACGGFAGAPSKVIAGGPMMGTALSRLDVPMLKASTGLTVLSLEHDWAVEESPCIRCNRCREICPMGLMPLFLDDAVRREQWDRARWLHNAACINCGCCTYICPAHRRLAETIVSGKTTLAKQEKEAQKP